MYMGIAMFALGAYCIFSEYYDMESFFKNRILSKKIDVEKSEYFKVKLVLGIFSISIGVLLVLNYFR
jgi:hypothetical protein